MTGKPRTFPKTKMIINLPAKGVIYVGSRIIIGIIFVCAGALKAYFPAHFAEDISAYRMVPNMLVNPIALDLPVVEIVCGLMILTNVFARIAILAVIVMLLSFCGALTYSLLRGLPIDCGCFGESWLDARPGIALGRDVLFLILAVMTYKNYLLTR